MAGTCPIESCHRCPSLQRGCGLKLDGLGLDKRGDPGEGDPTGVLEGVLASSFASAFSFLFFCVLICANYLPFLLIGNLAFWSVYTCHHHRPPPSPGNSESEIGDLPFLFTISLPIAPIEEGAGDGPSNSPVDAVDQPGPLRYPLLLPTQARGVDFCHGDGCTVTRLLVHEHELCWCYGVNLLPRRRRRPLLRVRGG